MNKKSAFTNEDELLLEALGVEVRPNTVMKYTPLEERVISAFEEIVSFYEAYNKLPSIDNSADIFERIYAIHLERIRASPQFVELLRDSDDFGLLAMEQSKRKLPKSELNDTELLNELGIDPSNYSSVTKLNYVKPKVQIESAEEIATRSRCPDFEKFKPLFEMIRHDLDSGERKSVKYKNDGTMYKGDYFILGGQIAYIADMGAEFINSYGRKDSKMRVIYSNGTQTEDLLMRSLQRALNKDPSGRRIEAANRISIFDNTFDDNDMQSGTIYVLRSGSNNSIVSTSRDLIHKIGVTGGDVNKRIANAKNDPTFLMAEVEIVATYKLANINRIKLESLIHKFFSSAQLDINMIDRFGKTVTVREWFLAPLFIIDEMMELIKQGALADYYYDRDTASIKKY